MLLSLDARTVHSTRRRGTGKNLVDLYRRLAVMRPGWRFVMFHRGQGHDDPFAGLPNVEGRKIEMPGDRWDLWERVRLPLAARATRACLLHCPANTGPRWPLVPMVLTIHDLIPLEEEFRTPESASWGRRVGAGARKARRILTPSEYSKRCIVETFGIPADKIIVNPWAADAASRQVTDPAELERVRAKYGLPPDRPYVFGFGAADPRKNAERILSAWAGLGERRRREFVLLLVGIQAPAMDAFRSRARSLGLDKECLLHGFADQDDLPALLSGATALCYPSLSEGFGLPLLDAFACGTPVLTSNGTSLPEVAGEAAVLVDPRGVESIREGLERLLGDESLRRDLVRRGLDRLKRYSWEACAATVCRVFGDVMQEAG